jgi:hypothetical protein
MFVGGRVRFRPGGHRLLIHPVHVLDVELDGRGRSSEGCRGLLTHPGHLVPQENHGIANLDLGVHDFLAAGAREAVQLDGAERLLVEVDGLGGTAHDQGRCGGVVAVRDLFHTIVHFCPPGRGDARLLPVPEATVAPAPGRRRIQPTDSIVAGSWNLFASEPK